MADQWYSLYHKINRFLTVAVVIGLVIFISSIAMAQDAVVEPNDNRVAAGSMGGDTLTLNLIAEQRMWFPGGEGFQGIPIQAFHQGWCRPARRPKKAGSSPAPVRHCG